MMQSHSGLNNYNNSDRIRYTFVTGNESSNVNSVEDFTFFYQICTFKNPKTNKYDMRKFVISPQNEFVSIQNYKLTKIQCDKFFAIKKPQEYKCYTVYNLDNINTPSLGDIMTSKSKILTNSYNYTGYSPF